MPVPKSYTHTLAQCTRSQWILDFMNKFRRSEGQKSMGTKWEKHFLSNFNRICKPYCGHIEGDLWEPQPTESHALNSLFILQSYNEWCLPCALHPSNIWHQFHVKWQLRNMDQADHDQCSMYSASMFMPKQTFLTYVCRCNS